MQSEGVFNYVPYSWVSLVHVKTEFYKGMYQIIRFFKHIRSGKTNIMLLLIV